MIDNNLTKTSKLPRKEGITCVDDFIKLRDNANKLLTRAKELENKLVIGHKLRSVRVGNTLITGCGDRFNEMIERYEHTN